MKLLASILLLTTMTVAAAEAPDVAELRTQLSTGQLTSRALVQQSLARIGSYDAKGPQLRAVIELNPDAEAIADSLDSASDKTAALHGIPVLLKDNIDTGDRMLTTAGSLAMTAAPALRDAALVTKLRAAGAVILGKTNLSEWANFRSNDSSSGWSGRGGQTRNPYDPERNPCGSSSGSAVAVAAGYVPLAIGTETDGSVVCPASINGIVGLKPTVGLVSRSGIIPISASQDTAGPMARSVADAARLLGAIAGPDAADPATARIPKNLSFDYVSQLKPDALRGVRLGVVRKLGGFNTDVDAVFEIALQMLRAQGAILVDPVEIKTLGSIGKDELTVLEYEFKDGLNRYLATRGPDFPMHTLSDLIAWNQAHADLELQWFGQQIFEKSQARGGLKDEAYREARARSLRKAGREGLDATLKAHQLDALIAPTMGPAWTTDLVNGDHIVGGNASTVPAVAGTPHLTVPSGFVHGLPVGLSFMGPAWSEARLLAYGYAYEQASKARRPPELK